MRRSALLAIAATLFVAPSAMARDFVVSEDKHTVNDASFTSRAAIVRMIGRTPKLTGSANIQLTDMAKSSGTVNVDLLSLDTGISMRNEHMRNFLETSKFPQAIFKFTSIKLDGNKLEPGKLVVGTATGTITIHGVTKPLTAPIELTYLPQGDPKYRPGDWLHFYSQFKTKVSDFNIALPAPMIGQKLANDLTIEIDGMAKAN
ncbi:MAG: YceI like family protein [Cyanobacteria bacterium RYN_339]|nr:YceI like family protein [Cyanobacteria bacterium RYN_339]